MDYELSLQVCSDVSAEVLALELYQLGIGKALL